ncbi:MAG: phosphate acyltransferase PlsX, partial [Candidatus Marinimicrobia bacterium]|nr:phosphate acyltransferase PlsX [Candidatus Neomarinimicrobiota bacterium]
MNKPLPKIAVDAMGGDNAPLEIVKGAAEISKNTDIRIVLVGDSEQIEKILKDEKYNKDQIEIVHTDEVITHHDSPKEALRRKRDSSLVLAAELCGQGDVHGMVSAGNTGAYVLSALKHIPRIEGVKKAAIASIYPTWNEENRKKTHSLLLDVGANIYYNVEEMVQIALMGMVYAADLEEIENPKVALLNIGEEPHKGGEPYRSVYKILDQMETVNFIGNMEGNDLLKGVADVVVAEGFVGNIVMKTIEGAASRILELGEYAHKEKLIWKLGLLALSGGIKQLKEFTDYSE